MEPDNLFWYEHGLCTCSLTFSGINNFYINNNNIDDVKVHNNNGLFGIAAKSWINTMNEI